VGLTRASFEGKWRRRLNVSSEILRRRTHAHYYFYFINRIYIYYIASCNRNDVKRAVYATRTKIFIKGFKTFSGRTAWRWCGRLKTERCCCSCRTVIPTLTDVYAAFAKGRSVFLLSRKSFCISIRLSLCLSLYLYLSLTNTHTHTPCNHRFVVCHRSRRVASRVKNVDGLSFSADRTHLTHIILYTYYSLACAHII